MKAALVGTGLIAREHLGCLRELPGVEVAAVCDLSLIAAEAAAERFEVPRWFTDHREMLAEVAPDVVHVTTPVTSHVLLAEDALESGAHVLVEKPVTPTYQELQRLVEVAERQGRWLVEDYNYLFNEPVCELRELMGAGELGDVVHADITFCQALFGEGSPFTGEGTPHPAASLPGGAIGDFLPHLASLAHAFVGAHRQVHKTWTDRGSSPPQCDEFRALIEAERGSAALCFSARGEPHGLVVRVIGTTLSARADVWGRRLIREEDPTWRRPVAMARHGLSAGLDAARASLQGPWQRLAGHPGTYVGVWHLIRRTYLALREGRPPPVTTADVDAVNRLRDALLPDARRP